jgi:hypothetical protein
MTLLRTGSKTSIKNTKDAHSSLDLAEPTREAAPKCAACHLGPASCPATTTLDSRSLILLPCGRSSSRNRWISAEVGASCASKRLPPGGYQRGPSTHTRGLVLLLAHTAPPTLARSFAARRTGARCLTHSRTGCSAEGAGFEPAVGVNPLRFSRPVHSTALPPLQRAPSQPNRQFANAATNGNFRHHGYDLWYLGGTLMGCRPAITASRSPRTPS